MRDAHVADLQIALLVKNREQPYLTTRSAEGHNRMLQLLVSLARRPTPRTQISRQHVANGPSLPERSYRHSHTPRNSIGNIRGRRRTQTRRYPLVALECQVQRAMPVLQPRARKCGLAR